MKYCLLYKIPALMCLMFGHRLVRLDEPAAMHLFVHRFLCTRCRETLEIPFLQPNYPEFRANVVQMPKPCGCAKIQN
jgi:hypothetical protein